MRLITHFSEEPQKYLVDIKNNTAIIHIRTDIHCENQEDFIEWVATEFIEEVNLNNCELNEQLIEAIINKNTKEEEENVRKQRDKLLEESDKEVLPDRENHLLWYNYRQALRDLPKQENFPWDIVWPDKPE